jgi:choline dehydrogenase-like flavoprotein
MAVCRRPNDTVFQKTLGLNDFYFRADDWDYPLGSIQMLGKSHGEQVRAEELPKLLSWLPELPFDVLARHSVDFWLTSEDLPHADNRITLERDGRVVLNIVERNMEGHRRLQAKLEGLLDAMDAHPRLVERSLYLSKDIPVGGTAHQAGTMRFGIEPATSVLDLDCKAHELDNLYVADASFFVSIGAVNPTLTIIANALRLGDHLAARL